jgi:hypothetical protein
MPEPGKAFGHVQAMPSWDWRRWISTTLDGMAGVERCADWDRLKDFLLVLPGEEEED